MRRHPRKFPALRCLLALTGGSSLSRATSYRELPGGVGGLHRAPPAQLRRAGGAGGRGEGCLIPASVSLLGRTGSSRASGTGGCALQEEDGIRAGRSAGGGEPTSGVCVGTPTSRGVDLCPALRHVPAAGCSRGAAPPRSPIASPPASSIPRWPTSSAALNEPQNTPKSPSPCQQTLTKPGRVAAGWQRGGCPSLLLPDNGKLPAPLQRRRY